MGQNREEELVKQVLASLSFLEAFHPVLLAYPGYFPLLGTKLAQDLGISLVPKVSSITNVCVYVSLYLCVCVYKTQEQRQRKRECVFTGLWPERVPIPIHGAYRK